MSNPSQFVENNNGFAGSSANPRLDEKALWLQFKQGNDLAFSLLYNQYVKRLFNYGMQWCRDRDLVLDTLQELFGMLWARRSEVAVVEMVNAYLYKSFRRLLINRMTERRKKNIFTLTLDSDSFEVIASVEDSIILQESSAEDFSNLRRALAGLTKRQREVIFLKFYNGLSYPAVAEVMEMGVDSVYNLMTRTLEALRTHLGKNNSKKVLKK